MAEAEDLPVQVMRAYVSEEQLMESTLYQSDMAKGAVRAEASLYAETLVRVLSISIQDQRCIERG
jgi:hypothetical protein